MEWIGVIVALLIFWGLPAWEAREKRKGERRTRRRMAEIDVAIIAAAQGRDGLMRKLLADLRELRVRRVVQEGVERGETLDEIMGQIDWYRERLR